MDETDLKASTEALMRWFESQDINPRMATIVMAATIARVIHEPEETRDQIQERADLFHQLLTHYIDKVSYDE